jgi:hypothetical protein
MDTNNHWRGRTEITDLIWCTAVVDRVESFINKTTFSLFDRGRKCGIFRSLYPFHSTSVYFNYVSKALLT